MQEFSSSLKTKGLREIFNSVYFQIEKLTQSLANNVIKNSNSGIKKSIFEEQFLIMAKKFDNISKEKNCDYYELKTKLTDIIEEFSLNNIKNNLDENINWYVDENLVQTMLQNFISALKLLESVECLSLKQRLQDCLDYSKEMGSINEVEDFKNLYELGTSIIAVFEPLQEYRKTLVSKSLRQKIALYSCQLHTSFGMLVQLVQDQHQLQAPIYTLKKYVCERMCSCFEMVINMFDAPNPSESKENFDDENNFVYKMDLVLDLIQELSNAHPDEHKQNCSNLWTAIEDVFSQAMAIAQVCKPYNFEAISGSCQSIMSEYDNLKLQLLSEAPDPALNNLFRNTLTDALYRLERKINISILTLVMEVFSDPFSALKKLVMRCGNTLDVKNRSQSDLSEVIENFDQITDNVMQIGLFAIACCKDLNRVNKIRNCLAGLESLDTELVSAIISFYLHPDNKEMRACVKLLTGQWQQEINNLHNVINLIIDSAEYCQVVLDDLQQRVLEMTDCLDNRRGVTQSQVQIIIQRAVSLSSQLTTVLNDIGQDSIDRQTIMMIRELKAAIYEADTAAKNLLINDPTEPQQLRVIKRCELVVNVVQRLQPALVIVMNNTIFSNLSLNKSLGGYGDAPFNTSLKFPSTVYNLPYQNESLTFIRTPYSVKNYKSAVSIQPANSTIRVTSDLSCLMPYIKKGREMRIERSIMYKTPKNNKNLSRSIQTKLKINSTNIRQHLFSTDSFMLHSDIDLTAQSIDLTVILEKLSTLPTTLSTSVCDTQNSKQQNDVTNKIGLNNVSHTCKSELKNVSFGLSFCDVNKSNKMNECSIIGGGDAPSSIQTPERLNDIQKLDKKIEILQKQRFTK